MDVRWAHNPEVVGSNPTSATVAVVELVDTSDCGSEGCGFDSPQPPHSD